MTRHLHRLLLGAFGSLVTLASAHAANLILNGSFEDDLSNWTFSGSVVVNGEDYPSDGLKAAVFNYNDEVPSGVLSQSFATVPGKHYTLEFDYWGWASPNLQRLGVEVVGAEQLISKTVSAYGSLPPVTYHPFKGSFYADSVTTTLTFRDLTAPKNTYASDLVLDRVSVSDYVPDIAGSLQGYRDNERLSIVCTNVSTGQSITLPSMVFSCAGSGLGMTAGDRIRLTANGIVR